MKVCLLDVRGVVEVSGEDRRSFLQGLISNDVESVSEVQTLYAALLTPQGKYLFDFFVLEYDGIFLLETEGRRRLDLLNKLSMYRLRSHVQLEDVTARFCVAAVIGDDVATYFGLPDSRGVARVFDGGIIFVDPRLGCLGIRILARPEVLQTILAARSDDLTMVPFDVYEQHRLELGVPDGSRDLLINQSTLLDNNFEALNGLSWDKGCYVGQEVTARMKYRGLVKKQLLPVRIEGAGPAIGTLVTLDQKTVGEMCTHLGSYGLARLRLDAMKQSEQSGIPLLSGQALIKPYCPSWL